MDKDAILEVLRDNEASLRAHGILRAGIFGSRARGDHQADSDTDILIEVDPRAPITINKYVRLKEFVASLFDGPVDVVSRDGLKPFLKAEVVAEAIYAF